MGRTVRWRAPGRVNLIGEHTDYNGGFALPFAIEQSCMARVSRTSRAGITVSSAQEPAAVSVPADQVRPDARWLTDETRWAGLAVGVGWALHVPPEQLDGLEIELDSEVPVGAGLSSSAALSCSVAAALNDLYDLGCSRADLAARAQRTENEFVGAPTGGLDQLAALLTERDHVLLCDMRRRETRQVPFAPAQSGLALLVVDSRAPHHNADGAYADRRRACEQAAAELGVAALRDATLDDLPRLSSDVLRRRARHVITEDARVLETVDRLWAHDPASIGPLLTASHMSMRDDFEITVPEVDVAVEELLGAGALGARMTGGGFGGCVIGLLPSDRVDSAAAAVVEAFAARGLAAPSWFVTTPSDGARPAA